MASNLVVNGRMIGGEIYELKAGKKVSDAVEVAKKDGLEEVFFHADGKDYVALGPSLMMDHDTETAIKNQKSLKTDADLNQNNKLTSVTLIDCDRENQGAYNGLAEATRDWKRSGLSRVALGAFATAGAAFGATQSIKLAANGFAQLSAGGTLNVAAGLGKSAGGSVGAVVLGLAAIGGVALAINGALQIPKASAFQTQEQNRLNRKVQESPIQDFLGNKLN